MSDVPWSLPMLTPFVCLSVCLSVYPPISKKTDEERITKLDPEMFHDETCLHWGQRSRVLAWVSNSCECYIIQSFELCGVF